MKAKLSKTATTIVIVFALFYVLPFCLAEDYSISYQLLNHPDGTLYYKLNVVIPQSLFEYYEEKSHRLTSNSDFAKFVTPYALKPMADSLWGLYEDDEDFANGVLTIVHQIPYEETGPAKYPVETIVENKGDCDLFSYIAASIIKAGGLDVILLHYEEQTHMNIGVHLSQAPQDARGRVYSVTHNGIRYYIAECTGLNWEDGWRVGECPEDLRQVSAQVISLENSEEIAPGQVSASFTTQEPSALLMEISPTIAIQKGTITLRGQLTPTMANENITIYVKVNSSPWTVLDTATTQSNGHFEYSWIAETSGVCYIRASWSGDELYAGAISPTRTLTVIPLFFVALLAVVVVSACLGAILVFTSRQPHQVPEAYEPQEPQPPEIP